VTEGVFRIREWTDEEDLLERLLVPHPNLGYRLRAGVRDEQEVPLGTVSVATNALGHRDGEVPRGDGVWRVACLGGSTTYGFAATENAATYPARLEELLRAARPGRELDVLNAGVPGWNSRTSLANYALYLAEVGFDVVVLMHNNNDVLENRNPRYLAASRRPAEEPPPPPPALVRVLERSAALRALRANTRRRRAKYDKVTELGDAGVEAFARNLRAAAAYFEGRGERLVLCTYPHLFRPTLDEARRVFETPWQAEALARRSPVAYEALAAGVVRYNDVIREVAAAEGLPLIDLDATFPKDPELFVDFVHTTDEGNRLRAAQVMAGVTPLLAEEGAGGGGGR